MTKPAVPGPFMEHMDGTAIFPTTAPKKVDLHSPETNSKFAPENRPPQ